jgi:hypothetical protein
MNYKHTQIGHLVLSIVLIFIAFFTILLTQTNLPLVIILIMIFILFILLSFSTLTVKVDKTNLKIKFGYGIFKKTFQMKEISSIQIVKNHWYYGWGIRVWLWPRMLIFNVSGFDAVEIKMKNKKIYRIGTDEPKKLMKVIVHNNS